MRVDNKMNQLNENLSAIRRQKTIYNLKLKNTKDAEEEKELSEKIELLAKEEKELLKKLGV